MPATRSQKSTTTAKQGDTASRVKPRTTDRQAANGKVTSTKQYDLLPAIREFDMAHNLNMIPNSEDSAMLSADDMVAANIPANLKLVAGTFSTTITDPTLFQVNSKDDFDDAELGIKVAQGRKRRALANSHDGEKALLFHMYGSLFEATNGIIAAITGTPDVYWAVCTDSLESPCPDLILKAGDRNAAVIEVKTKADMSDEDADEIVANCERYHMTACMATAANTSVLSLVDSDVPTTRDARSRGVILAEELLGEMYRHEASFGALTNSDTWIVFEKDAGGKVSVAKVPGVIDGKSNALYITLAMTLSAAPREFVKAHSS